MANPSPFPYDPQLTAISLAYKNDRYIADIVMPRTAVAGAAFRFRRYDKATYLTPTTTLVGRKSDPTQVELGFTEDSSFVFDYGLDDVIPVADVLNAPEGYNPQAEAAEYLTELLALDREKRVAGLVFDAGSYPAGCKTTLTGEGQFSHANSDPLNVLLTGLDVPFVRPNTIVMGQAVWSALRRNSKILQTVYPNANGNGVITPEQLADILDVDRVLVGTARANSAKRGAAPNISHLWGKHIAMLYVDPSATVSSRLTWGLTAEFGSRSSGTYQAVEKGLRGSEVVRVGESLRELVVCSDVGYFIQNAVA